MNYSNFNMEDFISKFAENCNSTRKKQFRKNEVITSYIQKRNQVCIILDGSADLLRYDFNGNRTIVDHFSKNDVFGEVFYNVTTNNELLVIARQLSTVLFFPYDRIKNQCTQNCEFHKYMYEKFPELILNKITDLNMRIELLTKRTIREKILGYFNLQTTRNLNKSFSLPFSLTDLADYLSVDRSAMMREIKLLKEEGFITKIGNQITLLQQ